MLLTMKGSGKFKRYVAVVKPYRRRIIFFTALFLCSCACNLIQPYLMGLAVEQLNAVKSASDGMGDVLVTCLIMGALAVASLMLSLISVRVSASVSTAVTADLRAAVYEQACNMSVADINRIGVTAMLDRSTYDIMGLMDFLSMALRTVMIVPVYTVVGCVMAFRTDGIIASVVVLCVPLIIVMIAVVTRIVTPLAKRSNAYLDKQNAIVHERLSGIRVIRAFGREPFEHERMAHATNIMADNFVKTNVTVSLTAPIATLLLNVVTVLILFLGGNRISAGAAVTAGELEQILLYIGMIGSAMFTAAFAIMQFPRVRVSVSRINEVLNSPRIDRSRGRAALDGSICAFDVTYRYPDGSADSLLPVTFTVNPGERVALIGGTGSGKSTLMMLLTGIARPTGGTLIIGGKPESALTVDEISGSVATVFQKSDFFTATLRENVDPLGTHTDEEVLDALDCAEFGEFARTNGLDYRITQNGNNLSGGQKQRVALARAFLKNAEIYLFDDSFSALDYLTEKRVRRNMNERFAGKTCVIATQRISTAYNCDRILLFDGGRLLAVGTHDQLMNNEVYKEIYVSQTGGER